MVEQLVREIKIQLFTSHPNVVRIFGFFDDLLHLYIVMECALDSRLSNLLAKGALPEDEAASVFYQLCSAVGQMHASSIIHRDLKPENVMLHEGVVKVCDFGWSVYRGVNLRTTFCGTPLYLSPEILVGNGYDEGVDVWALGVILYEMVVGGSPFGITKSEDLMNIVN
jgi:serine/threonine protein kinase